MRPCRGHVVEGATTDEVAINHAGFVDINATTDFEVEFALGDGGHAATSNTVGSCGNLHSVADAGAREVVIEEITGDKAGGVHVVAQMASESAGSSSVTMAQVAAAAGVSRSTVSRALQNHPRLPLETRERVCQLALEMGYRPNAMVSALMAELKKRRLPGSGTGTGASGGTLNTLAYLTAHPTRDGWRQPNPSFIEYFEGARDRALAQGYHLEPFWIHEPGLGTARFNRMLYTRHIRGVLIAPLPEPHGTVPLEWGWMRKIQNSKFKSQTSKVNSAIRIAA